MSPSNNPNPPSLLPEKRGFGTVETISAKGESLDKILSRILQHEEAGIPLVVRELNADPSWSPQPGSSPPEDHGGGGLQPPGRLTDPSFAWI